MKRLLVDIVNFNSDASCFSSSSWLDALAGGRNSRFYKWTELYVRYGRKVVLGLTGATLADIRAFNPEVLDLINANPRIFGTVARPFAHDIHLLRRPETFGFNVDLGRRAQKSLLPDLRASDCYLPPEFMLTGEQITLLAEKGFASVVINAARFASDQQHRIPTHPYMLRGLLGAKLGCIPINGSLTLKYLHSMQGYDSRLWREAIAACGNTPALLWRDGESSFLLPDGVAREEYWLANEGEIERYTLEDWMPEFLEPRHEDGLVVEHFPVHSFAAWMKEFRMLGFLSRLSEYESLPGNRSAGEIAIWLGLINSDVLSAVEKRAVKVRLLRTPDSDIWDECILHRSPREFEAEEYLLLLRRMRSGEDVWPLVKTSTDAHMKKLQARAQLLAEIIE